MRYTLILCLLVCGCVPAYNPNRQNKKIIEPRPSAAVAFDNYRKETANNFRILATNCSAGKYEFVSELVDEAKALDKSAKDKRSKPIDAEFAKELGNDKLDKDKAFVLLNKIADELDPKGEHK